MESSLVSQILQKFRGQTPAVQGNPLTFNQGLENQAIASGTQESLNPILQQIMQRFGLLNMVRNRSNEQVVDPTL